uniref:AlNc14C612G12246 protein n=1 Tax=Albugo laibachii Nc14 TaxID=890382 RepID=F0X1G2_9STRA|nr:AlNc14C612G12246 [Albugo laibachii Nc14]|eukprot:CCA27648.1 AlNc14C612G12246 [Albugo laibachii Nc14]
MSEDAKLYISQIQRKSHAFPRIQAYLMDAPFKKICIQTESWSLDEVVQIMMCLSENSGGLSVFLPQKKYGDKVIQFMSLLTPTTLSTADLMHCNSRMTQVDGHFRDKLSAKNYDVSSVPDEIFAQMSDEEELEQGNYAQIRYSTECVWALYLADKQQCNSCISKLVINEQLEFKTHFTVELSAATSLSFLTTGSKRELLAGCINKYRKRLTKFRRLVFVPDFMCHYELKQFNAKIHIDHAEPQPESVLPSSVQGYEESQQSSRHSIAPDRTIRLFGKDIDPNLRLSKQARRILV